MQRDARGYSCGSARVENRFQADRTPDNLLTRASHAGVENDLSHLAVSETQANTAPPQATQVLHFKRRSWLTTREDWRFE